MARYKFKSSGFSSQAPAPPWDLRYGEPKYKGKEAPMARKKAKMKKVMGEFGAGTLHSGSKTGPVVQKRKQAIAIGLSQIRKAMGKKERREY